MGSEWLSPFLRVFPLFLRIFPLFLRFSLLLLKDKGKQQHFTAKMGNFTPTPSAPSPCKTSRFFPRRTSRLPRLCCSCWAHVLLQKDGENTKTTAVLSESVLVQNGPNDHFGQNDLVPNWSLAFPRPKWTKMVHFGPFWPEEVHFGPFRSANHTLAIPERKHQDNRGNSVLKIKEGKSAINLSNLGESLPNLAPGQLFMLGRLAVPKIIYVRPDSSPENTANIGKILT